MIQTRSGLSAKRMAATAAALAMSASHIARDRFQRSSSAPAQGPITNAGRDSSANVSPVAAAEPVSANTCTGNATINNHDPIPEIALLVQSSLKSRFLRILTCRKVSPQDSRWQYCSVKIECCCGRTRAGSRPPRPPQSSRPHHRLGRRRRRPLRPLHSQPGERPRQPHPRRPHPPRHRPGRDSHPHPRRHPPLPRRRSPTLVDASPAPAKVIRHARHSPFNHAPRSTSSSDRNP